MREVQLSTSSPILSSIWKECVTVGDGGGVEEVVVTVRVYGPQSQPEAKTAFRLHVLLVGRPRTNSYYE